MTDGPPPELPGGRPAAMGESSSLMKTRFFSGRSKRSRCKAARRVPIRRMGAE